MNHLEHSERKHFSLYLSNYNELKNLPSLVADLSSVEETVRLKSLDNILDEIGTAKMQCCRAEQFSGLLDGLAPLMTNIQNHELQRIASILELLSTKHLLMIDAELVSFLGIFKTKDIKNLMKLAFLNESTQMPIKESLAYTISSFRVIDDEYDQCFSPILYLLLNRLKEEEKFWNKKSYNKKLDQKRCKYGFRTLATILNALSITRLGTDVIKQEIANRGGIEIGLRYLNHPSAKIRVMAALLFGLNDFRNEEQQVQIKKIAQIQIKQGKVIKCEQCGEIVPIILFQQHVDVFNTLYDDNIDEYKSIEEVEQADDENNSSYPAIKRVNEDLEEEGLIETVQSNLFSKNEDRYINVLEFFQIYQNAWRL
ncbi:MAG: hypothetical protein EZS28_008016 [Streblomastix strix]|uniref:Uncharacterized protein n=1 Tax=Streblomastix strix TaxID=222440 RepID=A0A5J4WPY9_9EUKA|nr:MAG: hypothetical protein EZS28_008016 [Streblomastix strix]